MSKFAAPDNQSQITAFYDAVLHEGAIPPHAVPITDEEYAALLDAQSSGMRLVISEAGRPEARPAPATERTLTAPQAQAQRDALLRASDWTQLADAPLTTEQRAAWVTYRAALRAVPEQPGFPGEITWPAAPGA
jgi:hypothetical protein